MMKTVVFLAAAVVLVLADGDHQHDASDEIVNKATARLEGGGVTGIVTFTKQEDGNVRITGKITGMPPGKYGFHVHEKGDLSNGCESTGGHFNPDGHDHGHPSDKHRHAGDLGNVEFNKDSVAVLDFSDHEIKLSGAHNIIGRALVLRSGEDDHGKGGHQLSPITGNSGDIVACGVIGIA